MIHCYKLCGYNIVLDVASGSIHCVDDFAYDVIRTYEIILGGNDQDAKNQDAKDLSTVAAQVAVNHPEVTKKDINEVITDIEELKSQGKLFSLDNFADVAETG